MRAAGMLVDKKELEKQKESVKNIILNLEKEIHTLAGKEFLISSPKQLGETLYDHMGLGIKIKKTASGARSTNADMLESMRDEHPIINKIINYREVSKVFNTYLEPLNNYVLEDGRVHPRFMQAGAATGRFSCENPNMQNIPRNTEIGLAFRKCFVAEKNKTLISADYSQIDLRAAAILSGDKKLMDIFKNDIDIHKGVAAEVLHKKLEDVTDEERRKAKAINFGILYGMGVNALKEAMHTDRKTAQDFYDNFKNTFSELIQYLEKVKAEATRDGYTSTLFGRRRQVPLLKSKLPFMRAQGERIAINAPIQGTSSDIIKLGMIQVNNILNPAHADAEMGIRIENQEIKMLLQIHDELVFECDTDKVEKYSKIIKESMENVLDNYIVKNKVPLKVNIATGKSLFEL
jgi:DNA polymerase-1